MLYIVWHPTAEKMYFPGTSYGNKLAVTSAVRSLLDGTHDPTESGAHPGKVEPQNVQIMGLTHRSYDYVKIVTTQVTIRQERG